MNEKRLLILGAGQYGKLVCETALAIGSFAKVAFLDDGNPVALGKLEAYSDFSREYSCAFVAIGNPYVRRLWLDRLEQAGFELPVLIHPKAWVSPSAQLAPGVIVEAMAAVNTESQVGRGCLLCAGSVVNHNAIVGDFCQVDCNAVVAANAYVPEGTKVNSCTVYEKV